MNATSDALPIEMKDGALETRGEDWGDLRVRHITLPAGVDFKPLLEGLPGDLCQCPHWGYILEGAVTIQYADGREEVSRAGDLYYWPAGHTGKTTDGVTFIEWSPIPAIHEVMEHLAAKMAAL